MKYSCFLPIRKSSQRIIKKNTKPFAGIEGGLLKIKLGQLLKCDFLDEIVLSSDDPDAFEVASKLDPEGQRIKCVVRPDSLCTSTTLVQDLINYVPTVLQNENIFWVHVTSPFVDEEVLATAKASYEKGLTSGYDSLMSVTKLQQFIWSEKKNDVINFDRSEILWPNTQDLEPLYEINHAFYISNKNNFARLNDRIGKKPVLFELDKIKSVDIDWPEDFELAELIWKMKTANAEEALLS